MDKKTCQLRFCREKIYNGSDWRKAMLAKRQELTREGIANFEDNEEFKHLTQCKGNIDGEFMDEPNCNRIMGTGKRTKCPKGFKINPYPPFNCIPKKQGTARARATSAKPKTARTPSAKPKTARAPSAKPTTARSPSAKPKTAKASSAKPKTKRCPRGFRRSKKTGNCESKI